MIKMIRCCNCRHGEALCLCSPDQQIEAFEKRERMERKATEMLKKLPINCRVCGERLSFSSSCDPVTWACNDSTGYDGDKRQYKEGRHLLDKHYHDSITHLSFEQWNAYERLEAILKDLLYGTDEPKL